MIFVVLALLATLGLGTAAWVTHSVLLGAGALACWLYALSWAFPRVETEAEIEKRMTPAVEAWPDLSRGLVDAGPTEDGGRLLVPEAWSGMDEGVYHP